MEKPWYKKTTFITLILVMCQPLILAVAKKLGIDEELLKQSLYGVLSSAGVYMIKEGWQNTVATKSSALMSVSKEVEKVSNPS